MTTLSLRLNDTDAEVVRKYAEFNGISVTELIKKAVFDQIEDSYDLTELRKAIQKENKEFYSMSELAKELDFD